MPSRGALVSALFIVIVGLSACARTPAAPVVAAPLPECTAPVVRTTSGDVCGLRLAQANASTGQGAADAYLGIRYATARRWAPPEPARAAGLTRATATGTLCPQPTLWADADIQDEDCLLLNVWTPTARGDGSSFPVIVFIHGGAFVLGAGSSPVLDGARLAARENVVVVTFNYRLGALGFLAGGSGGDRLDGNYGLRDQQLALAWVRSNVGAFGGNVEAITLAGESAGAMSVGAHLAMPASRGFFRAAIMQSNPYGVPFKTPQEAATVRRAFDVATETCVTSDLSCLRELPASRIVQAEASTLVRLIPLAFEGLAGFLAWTPVVDGTLLPEPPTMSRAEVPLIVGTDADEGVIFVGGFGSLPVWEYHLGLRFLYGGPAAARILERPRYAAADGDGTGALVRVVDDALFTCPNRQVLRRARTPATFAYEFRHLPSYAVWPLGFPATSACQPARNKVCHGSELPFVFGNPVTLASPTKANRFRNRYEFTPAEERLVDLVSRYWAGFAKRMDPNGPGLPAWPRFSEGGERLVLAEQLGRTSDTSASCDLWDRLGDTAGAARPPAHARLTGAEALDR